MPKSFVQAPFEVKSASRDDNVGRFEGYLSVYGVKDLGGDIVERGAFTKSIKEHGDSVPLLWQHDHDEPIGLLFLDDQDRGLFVKGEVDLEIEQGRRAQSGIEKKYCKGLSIGYDTISRHFTKDARHLTEVKLWEGSVVTFPMLTVATAQAKSLAALMELQRAMPEEFKAYAEILASVRSGAWVSPENLGKVQALLTELSTLLETPDQKAARDAAAEQKAARDAADAEATQKSLSDELGADLLAAFTTFHTTVKSKAAA